MNTQELLTAIHAGDYDSDIDTIWEALQARSRFNSASEGNLVRSILRPGDVCIVRKCSPKFLNGAPVKVIADEGGKYIKCEMLANRGRGRSMRYKGQAVSFSPICLTPPQSALDRAGI